MSTTPRPDEPGATRGRLRQTVAIMDLGTVLGIWAHPDDDIYLSAGLMAILQQMIKVHLQSD